MKAGRKAMRLTVLRKGFTITEMLVVIAVILILAVVLTVGIGTVYSQSIRVKCQHNLEQIGKACLMYASANRGLYPKAWDMYNHRRWYDTLLTTYLPEERVLGCPLEPNPPITGGTSDTYEGSREVIDALEWLADHQDNAGYWDVESNGGTSGSRGTGYRTGVTALALMAFLGNGCTDQYPPEYADNVADAITWLLSKQNSDTGKFNGYNSGTWYQYDHATATMAITLAYMITGRNDCREAAVKGLKHLIELQASSGSFGWGYGGYKNDISITGWCMQAIDAGKKAGLTVPDSGGNDMLAAAGPSIDKCLENMVNLSENYAGSYRYGPSWDADRTGCRKYAATAISVTSHLLMGQQPAATPSPATPSGRCRGAIDYVHNGSAYLIYAEDVDGRNSLYYYYYMTLANSLLGGSAWTDWCDAVFPQKLLDEQTLTGEDKGSWPTGICEWGGYGGRAYTTALSVMTIEAGQPGHWNAGRGHGQCSYGYNFHLGDEPRTPGANTIVAMDYGAYIICRGVRNSDGSLDANRNDPNSRIALRHNGTANVLFASGRVEALELNEFKDGMWTALPND
jgi:prepilin-type N-terminal cleavage/methylation domain-containing protein